MVSDPKKSGGSRPDFEQNIARLFCSECCFSLDYPAVKWMVMIRAMLLTPFGESSLRPHVAFLQKSDMGSQRLVVIVIKSAIENLV
jgi:hypothetical protein